MKARRFSFRQQNGNGRHAAGRSVLTRLILIAGKGRVSWAPFQISKSRRHEILRLRHRAQPAPGAHVHRREGPDRSHRDGRGQSARAGTDGCGLPRDQSVLHGPGARGRRRHALSDHPGLLALSGGNPPGPGTARNRPGREGGDRRRCLAGRAGRVFRGRRGAAQQGQGDAGSRPDGPPQLRADPRTGRTRHPPDRAFLRTARGHPGRARIPGGR